MDNLKGDSFIKIIEKTLEIPTHFIPNGNDIGFLFEKISNEIYVVSTSILNGDLPNYRDNFQMEQVPMKIISNSGNQITLKAFRDNKFVYPFSDYVLELFFLGDNKELHKVILNKGKEKKEYDKNIFRQ